ncbi:MAG: IS110 family transposase [Thaumarchaeota archaeon]|nr:IS110 family transposase [Nitrososphaerota archaeon]
MMTVGVDAHKRSCTVCTFEGQIKKEIFEFSTTYQGLSSFTSKIPEGSVIVIESSTTGKVLSRILSERYQVHMVTPPERKPSIKTDKRDAEKLVKEDMLGYTRRCYIPSKQIEEMRTLVSRQMQIGEKISGVKSQIHSLLERNMLQSEFEDLSDIFGVEGLKRIANLKQLPNHQQDMVELGMHLQELNLYAQQHTQVETEVAKMTESDEDCLILMSHPGIAQFTALAIKARIGDVSRFPTKRHLASYAGLVPGADNSGERVSQHRRVKHGDDVLKYAFTLAVGGAVKARSNTAVKRFYLKMNAKGRAPQQAEVAAARKLSWIVWRMLTSKQRYVEEDKYLTARKVRAMSSRAKRDIQEAVHPQDVRELAKSLTSKTSILERYPEKT